jgi:glycosyltransferase involved in cell wall biosynthesis
MYSQAIITVLDSINETTMPYNEFILYRCKHYPHEKQVVLLTGKDILIPNERIPESLDIHVVGKNPFKLRHEIKMIINNLEKDHIKWLIHLHSIRGAFSVFLGIIGVGYRKKTVYSIHSTFTGYKIYNKFFCACDVLFAHKTTCVSNVSYAKFPSLIKQIKGNRILPLQNGVNTERIDGLLKSINPRNTLSNIVTFIYVARMVPLKNHKFLIDVLSQIPDRSNLKFVFVGLEDKNGTVKAYAQEKGVIDNIDFTGLIQREKVYSLLSLSDVYISSSTLEGLPVSVLEGMYCGLPVILSDIPQHREVSVGCEGTTIIPFNAQKWANEIYNFSLMSPAARKDLGQKCKQHVSNHFSLDHMHKLYDEFYKEIFSV